LKGVIDNGFPLIESRISFSGLAWFGSARKLWGANSDEEQSVKSKDGSSNDDGSEPTIPSMATRG